MCPSRELRLISMKKALLPIPTTVLLITIATVNPALACRRVATPAESHLSSRSIVGAATHRPCKLGGHIALREAFCLFLRAVAARYVSDVCPIVA